MIIGPLSDDEEIADREPADLLTDIVGLLEDVRRCIWPGRHS